MKLVKFQVSTPMRFLRIFTALSLIVTSLPSEILSTSFLIPPSVIEARFADLAQAQMKQNKARLQKFRVLYDEYVRGLKQNASIDNTKVQVGIAPSMTMIQTLAGAVNDAALNVDVVSQRGIPQAGSFTAQDTIDNALSVGANSLLFGHSEVRHVLRESDLDIHKQIITSFDDSRASEIKTRILCVGSEDDDLAAQKEAMRLQVQNAIKPPQRLHDQLSREQVAQMIFACEPVWAIKGERFKRKATKEDAQAMALAVREVIAELYDEQTARQVRILYGGSVDMTNAQEYLEQDDVDGLLIGTASAKLSELTAIINIASKIGPKNGRVPYIGANWKALPINTTEEKPAYKNEVERKLAEDFPEESKEVLANLAKIFNHGKTAGSGNLFILPIDQAF
ncbi:MAG: triose-phosphate isomerase, partial [Pseudomonadota bacterium]